MEAANGELDEVARMSLYEAELLAGTEMKAFDRSGADALPHFERAYGLATCHPPLSSPWPQIAAYRLGHILMRDAKDVSVLNRAEKLFGIAASLPISALGPLPRIYRVAALHRLEYAIADSQVASEVSAKRALAFGELCRVMPDCRTHLEDRDEGIQIEGDNLNYLELLAYCTGDSYERIPRSISPIGDAVFDDEWLIVGTHSVGERRIRLNRALAEIELDERVDDGKVDVMFLADRVHDAERSEIWTKSSARLAVSGPVARLMAMLCSLASRSPAEQYRYVFGASDLRTRELKSVMQELKGAVRDLAGLNDEDVVIPGKRGTPARLNPQIRVAGMVHRKVVQRDTS